MEVKYKRALLKLSWEALGGERGSGFDFDVIDSVAKNIKKCADTSAEIAVVVGGGNVWRGRSGGQMDKSAADHMGMLATIINSIALKDSLTRAGAKTELFSAIDIAKVAKIFTKDAAVEALKAGKIVILAAGTGHPYFSTDTAAALKCAELEADILLMAKNIDAVYSGDPKTDKDAQKYDTLTYSEMIGKKLKAIDLTAAAFCMENGITSLIFELGGGENILKALMGDNIGTTVKEDK